MKAILFHNPKSGSASTAHTPESLKAVLHLAGYEVTYVSTKTRAFRPALKKRFDIAVVAGGDGTVGKVLKGIKHRDMPVGIWPLGTANNIATSLGISGEPEVIAAGWSLKRTKKLTVGIAAGPWGEVPFIEAVGFGVMVEATDSSIGAKAEGKQRLLLGKDAFRRALEKTKARDLKVSIDGKPFEGKVIGLEVLNIGYAGPGVPLRLSADPGDDVLDVVAIREEHREDMIAWLGPDEEATPPPLTARRGKEIVIHWTGKPPMRLDDGFIEPTVKKARISLTLDKDPITVLMPKPPRKPRGIVTAPRKSAAKKKPRPLRSARRK